jgi:hypothetical protein
MGLSLLSYDPWDEHDLLDLVGDDLKRDKVKLGEGSPRKDDVRIEVDRQGSNATRAGRRSERRALATRPGPA